MRQKGSEVKQEETQTREEEDDGGDKAKKR